MSDHRILNGTVQEQARQIETLTSERDAAQARVDLLKRLLHREHFFDAGRLGITPPLYGEPCPPCRSVEEELEALAPGAGAEGGG